MAPRNENDCDKCRILEVTVCPLLERAFLLSLEGIKNCDMKRAADKVYEQGRIAWQSNNRKVG